MNMLFALGDGMTERSKEYERFARRRVLVVGCGSIGRRHARILRQLGVKRLSLADPSEERLAAALTDVPGAVGYASYERALEDAADAVVLCTPPQLHIPQALTAIEAGCDVLMEKPLALRLDQTEQLKTRVRETGKIVMVGLTMRYHPGLVRAKRLLDNQAVGRLLSVRATAGENLDGARPNVDYRKLFVTAKDVGVAFDIIHEPDYVQWLVGKPVERVVAVAGQYSDLEMEGDDVAEMIIRFADRTVANVHVDFFQQPRTRTCECIGTRGTIRIDLTDWKQCVVDTYRAASGRWERETIAMERDELFRAMHLDFGLCVVRREQPDLDVEEAAKSLKIVLAAKQSAAEAYESEGRR